MTQNRIQISNVVENQLPLYVREEFPLVAEFLSAYYKSQEIPGGSYDLIQNIDKYIKLDGITNLTKSAILSADISFIEKTIYVDTVKSPTGTEGFPDSYGLLKINNEIITYTGKTFDSFTGCVRGFSGITSLTKQNSPNELIFTETDSEEHPAGSTIENLSILFLNEFLKKTKYQLLPGFEDRSLFSGLNQSLFLKQSKDFYASKGTDKSFTILFKSLYGEDVSIVRPQEYLFKPSDANNLVTYELVVEILSGDPEGLLDATLMQMEYGDVIFYAYAPIASSQEILSIDGKKYYQLSIDSGYNRDLVSDGSVYGKFAVHPRTKLIGEVSAGASYLDVDSTNGFPDSGDLVVTYSDTTLEVITYTSKSLTQFFGCSGISGTILDESNIDLNVVCVAESSLDPTQNIQVRITSVISSLSIENSSNLLPNNSIIVGSLGANPTDPVSNNWFFNNSSFYEVKSLSLVDSSDKTYSVDLYDNHFFRIGDSIEIIDFSENVRKSKITSILSEKSFIVKGQGELDVNGSYTIKRLILKVDTQTFQDLNSIYANVQNVYKEKDSTFVASNSLPYYDNQKLNITDGSVIFSGTFIGDTFQITSNSDHGFYTGDIVYYTPEKSTSTIINGEYTETVDIVLSSLFDEGVYYIKRISSTDVKFARSKSNLNDGIFITLDNTTPVNSNKILPYRFKSKTLLPQKLIRSIEPPIKDQNKAHETLPGTTGILINGVEILNYKSKDVILYGPIEEIEVSASGSNYDIISPPVLNISDTSGIGATGYCSVKGYLSEIKLLDQGFGYVTQPTIKITGGNGVGAEASPNMTLITHSVTFNAEERSKQVSIGATLSIIGFTTYHKFVTGEKILYKTNGQKAIVGLTTDSSYYVSSKDFYRISLHNNVEDALSGINTITMSQYGTGYQNIESYNKKLVVSSITVTNQGSGYENKKRTVQQSGISTSSDSIKIPYHGFSSGEIVNYSTAGSVVGGLVNDENYYVTAIDENNFKLSRVGISSLNSSSDYFYKIKQYIKLNSKGSGTHIFNYPNISVEISENTGISSINGYKFDAKIIPIFRGNITSVHLSNNGVGYGSSDVLNFEKQPLITLDSGSGAQLTPVISNGKIVEVIVNNSGSGYNSIPDLVISGNGVGAVLTPVIVNGEIVSVKIIGSGTSYVSGSTYISILSSGSLASFRAKIKKWTVNLFQKYFNSITADDGFITDAYDSKYELKYTHLYAPRKLREVVYSSDQGGKILYGKTDLKKIANIESSSTDHSPIIGWAYDGNPIYGPYGYTTKSGGVVTQLKSGYILELKEHRPPQNIFPEGFFVEDYTHYKVSSENILDEKNGRFCVTPEFPNGTYAYFSTVSDLADSSGSGKFSTYKRPVFPYLIGNFYNSKPNEFNFKSTSNQDDYNIDHLLRNTNPYNILSENTQYNYIDIPNKLNQKFTVKSTKTGSIENIGIITGGNNYKVGDKLVFNNENTGGFGLDVNVYKILGKKVNSISVASTYSNIAEIYPSADKVGQFDLFSNNYHSFKNLDIVTISGLSTISSLLNGSYEAGISSNRLVLKSGVGTVGYTGIVTYFTVFGNLDFPKIKENDVYTIGNERVKVLNVYKNGSQIRVLRQYESTVGTSYTAGNFLYEKTKKLSVNVGYQTSYNYIRNRQIYFNPVECVGIGTRAGVGIGYTVYQYNSVGVTTTFIPTKTILIPNHGLNTGDTIIYNTNGGSALGVSTNGISTSLSLTNNYQLYVAKIDNNLIGIATVRVGVGSTGIFVGITSSTRNQTTLYLTGIGTGVYHSFKTNYPTLTGNVEKNTVTVSTAQTHHLKTGDTVFVDINPFYNKTIVLKYNDYHRKVVSDPKLFLSTDVNILTSAITIANHNFTRGQKVVYTSSSPSLGLSNNHLYYIIVVDDDTVQLCEDYYDSIGSNPAIVNVISASGGTLSSINPPLYAYKDSTLTFDLSDPSLSYVKQATQYSAFKLEFYVDSSLKDIFEKTRENKNFEISRYGSVGISTDARVVLSTNKNFPLDFYYNLVPVYNSTLPIEKEEISADTSILDHNRILLNGSGYNGEHLVTIDNLTDKTFSYNIPKYPESVSYGSSTADIKYHTNSLNDNGPIFEVQIKNSGKNYKSLPSLSSIASTEGIGALVETFSNTIGEISKVNPQNIGFDFPSDKTLSPTAKLPQIIKIEALSSFESIGITSFGRGYNTAPKLLVFDGKTNKLTPEADLRYYLGNSKIEILQNTYGLSALTPRILPIYNSNGVGISSISYNDLNKNVTVTLSVGFSTANSFPFTVGDKVMIENISVGVNSEGKGYNSEYYDYNLFTIVAVDQNLGGIGTVAYSLDGLLNGSEYPGTFDIPNSSGRIIAEKDFPIFNSILKKNNFNTGEVVVSGSNSGVVENWNVNTETLIVSSKDTFESGNYIQGLTSKTLGITSTVTSFDSTFNLGSFSKVSKGTTRETGFLNDNLQRMQDSDYYQNFSYSIKSKIPYDNWNDVVSTLNHSVGFKKFGDLQMESKLPSGSEKSLRVGLSTEFTSFEVTTDLIGVGNLNTFYDFDLVKENSLNNNSRIISNEITFANKVLSDYFESVGNRVLSIDDVSPQFNSNPRPSKFSEVHRFFLSDYRAIKYISYVRDKRYIDRRQIMLVNLLHNNTFGYLNQYGRVESLYDLGSFDFSIEGSEGLVLFYPIEFSVNDYDVTTLQYNIKDFLIPFEGRNLGGIIDVDIVHETSIPAGSTRNIVDLPNTYRSSKIFVQIVSEDNKHQYDEINLIHDGDEVSFIDYGQLTTNSIDQYGNAGFGTYHPYLSGSQLKVDFISNAGVGVTVNSIAIAIADSSTSGIGTVDMKHARLEARSVSIGSTSSPIETVISDYPDNYDGAYFIVQVSDLTNNVHQLSEVTVVDDGSEVYISEFAKISTEDGHEIGTIGARRTSTTQLIFTPEANINVDVKVYLNALRYEDDLKDVIELDNTTIETRYGTYTGTERDVRKSFELYHNNDRIFQRDFEGNDSNIVSVGDNTIQLSNHFFVTGEQLIYSHSGAGSSQAIGIADTSFVGIGVTSKLPSSVYVVKVDENLIKLASSAENALLNVPKTLNITNVGVGTSHTLSSTNQNAKVIIALDNIIQSPIVATALTSSLSQSLTTTDDVLYFTGISSFFGGDLIKIGNEIMKIESVGVGSTNTIRVQRPWLGTPLAGYSTGSLVTKVAGNYNIIANTLNFVEAPYGNLPYSSTTNAPDDRDWSGISTGSHFQGRSFLRSGKPNSSEETYSHNYIFDDISTQFDGSKRSFDLKSNQLNVTGISTENAVVLINDIFQGPGLTYDYTLQETSGITSVRFTGTATSFRSDVNTSNLPVGGVIISVGSFEGFGYQPLVSAGGTATVSIAGTISSISIGNSGSGYRSGSQVVRVGVGTSSVSTPNIQFIGTAVVSGGHVVSIAITNPGTGYTSSNRPYVIIDAPLPYSDIPLKYISGTTGFGTEATVDIVVGQGSSVIDFEIKNNGYGYGQGDILTLPTGGVTGIQTTSGFNQFTVTVQKTFSDKFTGWSLGELQVLDKLDDLFDGSEVVFPLKVSKNLITIRSERGSNVNVQDTLLIFINDTLQVPGKAYIFNGGSKITFTEAPKQGDSSKILFYKGSGVLDVIERNILETVKYGDDLTLGYDASIGQSNILQETSRTVTSVNATDNVSTNPYFGPGNTEDETLYRTVTWTKQTKDKIIDGRYIGKDRTLYEPSINPFAYLIKPVGIGSTIIYVDNIRPFFNPQNENNVTLEFQKQITLVSQNEKISAAATSIVSSAGTITQLVLNQGGMGYHTSPIVTIQSPVGLGTTQRASGITSISTLTGIVTSISLTGFGTGYSQNNPPVVLIEPPTTDEETNEVGEYKGDSGVIVGFGLTTTLALENKIILDLHIPNDSYLRSTNVTGIAVTLSSLSVGDYFIVYNSNVGSATTAIYSGNTNGGFVAIGTQFVDNVYQVDTSEIIQRNITGIGTTNLRRVFARIIGISSLTFSSSVITFDSGVLKFDSAVGLGSTSYTGIVTSSNYFGNFSWGRITLPYRSEENNFDFYGTNGIGGISTSAFVRRTIPLKYTSYIQ